MSFTRWIKCFFKFCPEITGWDAKNYLNGVTNNLNCPYCKKSRF